MADPIRHIEKHEPTQEEKRRETLTEIEDALVDNKEAVLGMIQLTKNLNETGITSALNGLLAEGDEILHILVREATKEGNTEALKNLLLIGSTLGKINMSEIEVLLDRVKNGVSRVAEDPDPEEKTGYLDLIKKVKDPEVNKAITVMFRFLEGMGEPPKNKDH
ncbi:DUF1641 domain-containing protein [Alkalicoccus chagannorensis]|uniref:DUF1641 domain-containing protein n=1 Tax=Alkalicoccus chagannorensis TaxID=427072 RepID=UPI000428E285|nr:DUF1641 domain-containing protein [Alkalicoccus chagannorensis]